jgi:hypothetical protein
MIRETIKYEFVCDTCGISWNSPMTFKISKDSTMVIHDIITEFKSDYHFCSSKCFINFFKQLMDELIVDSHFIDKRELTNER